MLGAAVRLMRKNFAGVFFGIHPTLEAWDNETELIKLCRGKSLTEASSAASRTGDRMRLVLSTLGSEAGPGSCAATEGVPVFDANGSTQTAIDFVAKLTTPSAICAP